MKIERYTDSKAFGADVLDILNRREVQNNLLIGIANNVHGYDTSNWLMATVKDDAGDVVLTAICTPPFKFLLYETDNKPNDEAVKMLANELKSTGFTAPGVLGEQSLARRFAEVYGGESGYHRHSSLNVMRLDAVADIERSPGHCRVLTEDDLFFAPYWADAMQQEI